MKSILKTLQRRPPLKTTRARMDEAEPISLLLIKSNILTLFHFFFSKKIKFQ